MKHPNFFVAVAATLGLIAGTVHAQAPPDNSKSNENPVNSKTSTADNQKNDATDLSLTQQIRKSVLADKSLSTYAHNVKIIAVNGSVTLNGVVRDGHEKSVVEQKAQAIAGKGNVTNDLTIAPPR